MVGQKVSHAMFLTEASYCIRVGDRFSADQLLTQSLCSEVLLEDVKWRHTCGQHHAELHATPLILDVRVLSPWILFC